MKIKFNSPVVLTFAILSGVVLIMNLITNGMSNSLLFSIYKTRWSDPLQYIRLFTHVLGHGSVEHYANNMILFLMVGPLLEEKYGGQKLLGIILLVAFVTGLVHILLPGNHALLGASGICFAFIILASITGRNKENEIPLTLLIVALIYIGQQVYEGVFMRDNISQLTHIVGGIVGGIYGLQNRKES